MPNVALDTSNAPVRGFHRFNRAWYAATQPAQPEEFMVGLYHPQGGTSGEFALRWQPHVTCFRLEVFDDAWHVLPQFQDLLDALAAAGKRPGVAPFYQRPPSIGAEEVEALLLACGIVDLTAKVRPE